MSSHIANVVFPAASLPGFDTPAVSFEQPFAMLHACHERVLRSLDLIRRVVCHIDDKGHDASVRSAARDVLRYFDIAAPLHHEDEEKHVFPRLLAQGNAPLRQAVQALQQDHEQMRLGWATIRTVLQGWVDAPVAGPISAATRADIEHFLALYHRHIDTEEQLVYPAAQTAMSETEQAAMGREMQARRLR